jgi:AGZA family xanthine/uracil permease-like MFS transporter
MLDEQGRVPNVGKVLIADSSAASIGALLGTSTTTSYIESGAGISAGGRTGLTAVTVGVLFLLALVFSPIATAIPAYATAPAILFVACLMARALTGVDWSDLTEFVPAVVTVLSMPFTFSIATGIGLGFVSYVAIKTLCGRVGEVSSASWAIAAVFLIYFVSV